MSRLNATAKAMLKAMGEEYKFRNDYYREKNNDYEAGRADEAQNLIGLARKAALSVPEPVPFEAECPDCEGGGLSTNIGGVVIDCPRCRGRKKIWVVEVKR